MPLILVLVMVRSFGERRSWTEGLGIAPFALFAGVLGLVAFYGLEIGDALLSLGGEG